MKYTKYTKNIYKQQPFECLFKDFSHNLSMVCVVLGLLWNYFILMWKKNCKNKRFGL